MDRTYIQAETAQIAQTLLEEVVPSAEGATVVALQGELGAGKTTLVQSIAHHLGVAEKVVSPTFVIAKFYETKDERFVKLVHIDAYKIESIEELKYIDWDTVVASPNTLVIVEWPENIEALLPSTTHWYKIDHYNDMRHISELV